MNSYIQFCIAMLMVSPLMSQSADTLFLASGLKIVTKNKCNDSLKKPENGQSIKVHYIGTFKSGEVFESSYEIGYPFKFELGKKEVIPGWDEGFLYLCEGQKAVFIVPPTLAYGEKGLKHHEKKGEYLIPPDSTLIYEVHLVQCLKKKNKK